MSIDVDLSRTHEVIDMLNIIRDGVKEGCKDRCYISGSGADSVKFVLEEAGEYLRAYAREDDNSIRDVLDMMKEKMRREAKHEKNTYII